MNEKKASDGNVARTSRKMAEDEGRRRRGPLRQGAKQTLQPGFNPGNGTLAAAQDGDFQQHKDIV
jgi:hypothetical protein